MINDIKERLEAITLEQDIRNSFDYIMLYFWRKTKTELLKFKAK